MGETTIMRYRVLRAIQAFHAAHGYGPSFDWVAGEVDLKNRASVHFHVQKLLSAGLLLSEPGIPRSIRLTDAGREKVAEIILRGGECQ